MSLDQAIKQRNELLRMAKHALILISTVSGIKGTYWRYVENELRSIIDRTDK